MTASTNYIKQRRTIDGLIRIHSPRVYVRTLVLRLNSGTEERNKTGHLKVNTPHIHYILINARSITFLLKSG